jgi:hypothetical protein
VFRFPTSNISMRDSNSTSRWGPDNRSHPGSYPDTGGQGRKRGNSRSPSPDRKRQDRGGFSGSSEGRGNIVEI